MISLGNLYGVRLSRLTLSIKAQVPVMVHVAHYRWCWVLLVGPGSRRLFKDLTPCWHCPDPGHGVLLTNGIGVKDRADIVNMSLGFYGQPFDDDLSTPSENGVPRKLPPTVSISPCDRHFPSAFPAIEMPSRLQLFTVNGADYLFLGALCQLRWQRYFCQYNMVMV
jgi:hypothetical protein